MWRSQSLVNWDTVLRSATCILGNLRHLGIRYMVTSRGRCKAANASGSFFPAGAYVQRSLKVLEKVLV